MYVALMADPPWPERGGGKRGAQEHYPVISKKEEIAEVMLGASVWAPAQDAHLYLWVTNTYLPWGLWLIDALGFAYKTNFPWVKPERAGLGQYGRGAHELLLFAVKGQGFAVRTTRRDIRTDFLVGAPRPVDEQGRMIHSAKPERGYELVDARTIPGPRAELFARKTRPGWTAWGNEVSP